MGRESVESVNELHISYHIISCRRQTAKTSCSLGSGYNGTKVRKTKKELDRYRTYWSELVWSEKKSNDLASKCGTMCLRHGLNSGLMLGYHIIAVEVVQRTLSCLPLLVVSDAGEYWVVNVLLDRLNQLRSLQQNGRLVRCVFCVK